MTTTPKTNFLPQNTMRELYTSKGMEEYLKRCTSIPVIAPNATSREVKMHETYCCKKRTFRYLDPETREEVALVSYVTSTSLQPLPSYIMVVRLKVDGEWYEAELPTGEVSNSRTNSAGSI